MDSALFKKQAKTALKGKTGTFALAFLILLCVELVVVCPFAATIILTDDLESSSFFVFFFASYFLMLAFMTVVFPLFIMTFIKGIIKAAELPESEEFTFKSFWSGLKGSACGIGNFWWTALWTYLWELLCLLPLIFVVVIVALGIEETEELYLIVGSVVIASYFGAIFVVINRSIAYSMNWFVLAKKPETGVLEAMNISKKITKGHKGELFGLSFSFIGWFILCMFTVGLLLLWLMPYYCMTMYNAFNYLIENYNKSNNEPLSSNSNEYDSEDPYFANNLIPPQKPESEE